MRNRYQTIRDYFQKTESDFVATSRAFPKFESYGMLETAASVGWKVQDAIVGFHGIGRLGRRRAFPLGRAVSVIGGNSEVSALREFFAV